VARDDFVEMFEPPDDYDPFGVSQPIPRVTARGSGKYFTDPPNHVGTGSNVPTPTVSFWDRPKPPRDWYWFLGRLGSGLIITSLLMFLFVGYQLWGTGIEEAQSQNRLDDSFAELVADVGEGAANPGVTTDPGVTKSTTPSDDPAPSETREPIPIVEGDPLAIIELPTIGVRKFVVAGVRTADLKKAPGHYPDTPLPGELGNAAIAGHRTTYGEPFRKLDELEVGDEIRVTDLFTRQFVYRVTGTQIVGPADSWVVATTDPTIATLTLTTCHPEFSAKLRLIVSAELDTSISPVAAGPAAAYPTAETSANSTTVSSSVSSSASSTTMDDSVGETTSAPTTVPVIFDVEVESDIFERGWFSDGAAWSDVLVWTALEIFVVWGAWLVAKRFRNRLLGATVGFAPFLVVLYFVFQNVNRLLPPSL